MSREDPIEEARRLREIAERDVVRRHVGREPSDPPSSSRDPSERKLTGGFRAGIAHFRDGAERMSKRVALLMALVGGLMTMIGACMMYWATHQGFIRETALTGISADLKELRKIVEDDQRNNQTSFAGIKTDIEWLKREQKVQESQPIKSEKKH